MKSNKTTCSFKYVFTHNFKFSDSTQLNLRQKCTFTSPLVDASDSDVNKSINAELFEQLKSLGVELFQCFSPFCLRVPKHLPSIRGLVDSLTAHQKSCIGVTNRFRFFAFMFRKVENPCSHSHVDGNINNCETAREASVGYDCQARS